MAREAALFRVQGPCGIYYAVYEAEQQSLFTEANEKGARDHAAELGLMLSPERNLKHADLMRLTGRDAPLKKHASEKRVEAPQKSIAPAPKPLEARLPRSMEPGSNDILTTRDLGGENPFASAEPLKASSAAAEGDLPAPIDVLPSGAVNRDVINVIQSPRSGRRGNPFADHSQK